jgi:hypothetical protein
MNRATFQAIRRAYRAAHSTDILAAGGIEARMAATSMMRAATGKWDTCEPVRNWWAQCETGRNRKYWIRRPHVSAACTRWIAAHAVRS